VRTLQWAAFFHFIANESYYAAELTGRAFGYNGLVIALLSDGAPYVLLGAASSTGWGEELARRYLLLKMMLQVLVLAACVFPIHLLLGRHHAAVRAALKLTATASTMALSGQG